MKKGKLTRSISMLTILGLALTFGSPTFADGNQTAITKGQIELKENDEPTSPVDPLDPSKPAGDEDPNNPSTNNKGPLSLDVAPGAFDFGVQKVYGNRHTYYVEKDFNQFLQVTDNRDADVYGWTVKVKQDGYLRNDSYELSGATIAIPKGVARNSLNDDPTQEDSILITKGVEINNQDQTVFASPKENLSGKGTSTDTWKSKDVSLTIPKQTAKSGSYHNTVEWTLTAEVEQ